MSKKAKLNKTVTQVKDMPLQILSAGLSESDAIEAQDEISKRMNKSFKKMSPCEKASLQMGLLMMQHNIADLSQLISILNLGNALVKWDDKTQQYLVNGHFMQIFTEASHASSN